MDGGVPLNVLWSQEVSLSSLNSPFRLQRFKTDGRFMSVHCRNKPLVETTQAYNQNIEQTVVLQRIFERKSVTIMYQRAMLSVRISSRAFRSLGTKEHGNEFG